MNPDDDESLYNACCQEGSDAQIDAFATLWRYLYRITASMLRDQPEGEALASDCAQQALIKIHRNLAQCHTPATFRRWAGQVARRVVLDELRRPEHVRQVALADDDQRVVPSVTLPDHLHTSDLRALLLEALRQAPLSDRSRRVIVGRYFDEQPDEVLAQAEQSLSGQTVLPSHIQVTRARNMAKLRADATLLARLRLFLEI